MIWVLILIITPYYDSQVSITTQEFNSKIQCEYVIELIRSRKNVRLQDAFCVLK